MEREVVIGKYTLESLTNGMYADPMDLYREYIQNAVDSIDCVQGTTGYSNLDFKIEIKIDELAGTVVIRDNGEGIRAGIAVQTLIDIGNSEKDKKKSRGFRGIGRLAGLGYSNAFTFTTSHIGENQKTIVRFDTNLLKRLLLSSEDNVVSINDVMQRIVRVEIAEEESAVHYFEVELEGVPSKEKLLDCEEVENYLLQHAPLPFDSRFSWSSMIKEKCRILGYQIPEYHIELNGKQLFKPYKNNFICDRVKRREDSIRDIEVKPFFRDEYLAAILWYGISGFYGTIMDNQIKGIRIRQGNLQIGDKSACNALFKEERFNGWMVGELHVLDPELTVNARRDYFEKNEAHYDLAEAFKSWSVAKSREIRKISHERCLSEKKKEILAMEDIDDVDELCYADMSLGESEFIDQEECEEITEIDFMDKLSWIIKQQQGSTKYLVLNVNTRLTSEQKKIIEKIFDIISQQYKKKEAEKLINIIANNL